MTDEFFDRPPRMEPDASAHLVAVEDLRHIHASPGEFVRVLFGKDYGFNSITVLVSDTQTGGGPSLHVHDVEEAHVLLEGTAEYLIGDERLIAEAPYVARIPAGVPHTFMNVGTAPFRLISILASNEPSSTSLQPSPLMPVRD